MKRRPSDLPVYVEPVLPFDIEYARESIDRGFEVVPCAPCEMEPDSRDYLFSDYMSSHEHVERYWKKRPNDNYAIATGLSSNLVVFSIKGKGGQRAIQFMNEYGFHLPRTARMLVGDTEYVFIGCNSHRIISKNLLPGTRIIGEDDYVIGPGSIDKNGCTHRLKMQFECCDIIIEPIPDWIPFLLEVVSHIQKKDHPSASYDATPHKLCATDN